MQDRKRLEEQIAQDVKISGLTSDLDTLFELGREGENVNADLEREMKSFSGYLEKLETQMLLAGDNAAKSAIVTIHPGAGGTESQDWAEMLLRMYYRWAERNRFEIVETDRLRDIAIHARGQAFFPVSHHRICGEGDNRHMPSCCHFCLADGLGGLKPIHFRHLTVHKDNVKVLLGRGLDTFQSIVGNRDITTLLF